MDWFADILAALRTVGMDSDLSIVIRIFGDACFVVETLSSEITLCRGFHGLNTLVVAWKWNTQRVRNSSNSHRAISHKLGTCITLSPYIKIYVCL
jgi:hypothetical protein